MKMRLSLYHMLPSMGKELAASITENLTEMGVDVKCVEVRRVECESEVKDINADERSITAYLSTRHIDRDMEVVIPKGIDLSQYKLNPVILQGHDYRKPQVGKGENLRKDDIGLRAKIVFAPPVDGEVDYFLLSKFMPLKFSIGFIPVDFIKADTEVGKAEMGRMATEWPEFKSNPDRKQLRGIHRKTVLIEASVTPMPSNVYAGQISKALEDEKITAEEAGIIRKGLTEPDPEKDDEMPTDWAEFVKEMRKTTNPEELLAFLKEHLNGKGKPAPKPAESQPASVTRIPHAAAYRPKITLVGHVDPEPEISIQEQIANDVKKEIDKLRGKV